VKKLIIIPLLVAILGCTTNPAVTQGVSQVDASQGIILPQYAAYVEADPKLSADQKKDRTELVESLKRLMASLKEAVK
jgi:hypothetical protein